MAQRVLHTDDVSSVLPHAISASNQPALDASTRNSPEGDAHSGSPFPHFLFETPSIPQDGSAFLDSTAFFEVPNARSRADFSCFAHPHAMTAHPNVQLQAYCAGFSHTDALCNGAQPRLTAVHEGFANPQQVLCEPSSVACVPPCEKSVCSPREEQVDSAEPYGLYEVCTHPNVKSNDPQPVSSVVCAGSVHAGTKFQDHHEQSTSRVSLCSCEESTSLHEEVGDSTEPRGSSEDSTFSPAGFEDVFNDNGGFTYIQESRGDVANTQYVIQDPFKESVDPFFQQPDAHATSILQPCMSECSSAISLVTNATSEVTSRVDKTYTSVDGTESHWTDAKHGSYLDYMETNFVNNLFGREYCALDVCGQVPFHKESRSSSPLPSSLFEFKSWQSGDWHRRSLLKPPLPTFIPLSLLKSPWVDHFRHHKFPRVKHQIKMGNRSTSCGVEGEEEVNSPSTELQREALRRLHTSRSKTGHEDNFFCKNCSSCDEAVGALEQDGLQEFAHYTENSSFSNSKKRGFEIDTEQEPFIRCRQDRSFSDKREVVGSTK